MYFFLCPSELFRFAPIGGGLAFESASNLANLIR
jgi:hypothetical protein